MSPFEQILQDLARIREQTTMEERWEYMEDAISGVLEKINHLYEQAQDKDTDAWREVIDNAQELERLAREGDAHELEALDTLRESIHNLIDTEPYKTLSS